MKHHGATSCPGSGMTRGFEAAPQGLRYNLNIRLIKEGLNYRPFTFNKDQENNYSKEEQRVIDFLRKLLSCLLYEIQIAGVNIEGADRCKLNEINQTAFHLSEELMQTTGTTDQTCMIDSQLAFLLAAILMSCTTENAGLNISKVTPYIVAYVFSLFCAFAGEKYLPYMDACFKKTIFKNGFTPEKKQENKWERVYFILQDKYLDGPWFNWKNTLQPEYLSVIDRENYQISIPLSSYLEVDDVQIHHKNRTVIVDSLFRFVNITDHLLTAHLKQNEYSYFLPHISVSGISTGELDFVELFASIYGGLASVYRSNPARIENEKKDTMILILDEPDASFHPEWSRKFIRTLTETLSRPPFKYYSCRYQIIMTTHSPIILSDIPATNIKLLKVIDGVTEISDSQYGLMNNINDIMISAFFVQYPFGSFAEHYVSKLLKEIEDYGNDIKSTDGTGEQAPDRETLISKINVVSEPYVRTVLRQKLEDAEEKSSPLHRRQYLLEQKRRIDMELEKLKNQV